KSSRSAPAVKAAGPPAITTQRMAAAAAALSSASDSTSYMASVSAFFFSGRLSRRIRTGPLSVTMTWPAVAHTGSVTWVVTWLLPWALGLSCGAYAGVGCEHGVGALGDDARQRRGLDGEVFREEPGDGDAAGLVGAVAITVAPFLAGRRQRLAGQHAAAGRGT